LGEEKTERGEEGKEERIGARTLQRKENGGKRERETERARVMCGAKNKREKREVRKGRESESERVTG